MRQHKSQRQFADRIPSLLMTLTLAVISSSMNVTPVGASEHAASSADKVLVTVYKRDNCNCCNRWVAHLEENSILVEVRSVDSTRSVQSRLGVPGHLRACHTAEVDGYWIEGHVPADLIEQLLFERPADIAGLAVAGMPVGSPGMEGSNPQNYAVIAAGLERDDAVYASRGREHRK